MARGEEEEGKKWKDRDRIRVARLGNAPCVSLSPGISLPLTHTSMYRRTPRGLRAF